MKPGQFCNQIFYKRKPRNLRGFFYWFIHSEISLFQGQTKKEPAMDIAGLCLPLKPQKEKD
jgi:hypothetical protein